MYFLIMLIGKANDGRILLGLIFPAVILGIIGTVIYISKKREKRREKTRTEKR